MNWFDLSPQVWAEVFTKLNRKNEYGETIYDTRTVYNLLLTCQYFNDVMNHDFIWRQMCMEFADLDRLEFMHEHQDVSWRDLYKIRITGVIKQKEIRIGDQSNPENCVLFQIMGNGHVYISTDWSSPTSPRHYTPYSPPRGSSRAPKIQWALHESRQYTMAPITAVCTELNKLYERDKSEQPLVDKFVRILPFTKLGQEQRKKDSVIQDIRGGLFVNISTFSPFVLLLSKHGEIYELMFLPHGVRGYEGMYVPHLVELAGLNVDEKVVYIKATAMANYAVTNLGRLFAWTLFDHPTEARKMAALPVEIAQLKGIKKIKQVSHEHTKFYLAEGEPLVVENDQIFYLIVESYLG